MTVSEYDTLAPHYRRYAQRRAAYCAGVDRCLLAWRPSQVSTMLDVGSGDGVRAVQLAGLIGAQALVLSDPSAPMLEQCRTIHSGALWKCAAESLPARAGSFDVVTCLWNVLGAIEQPAHHLAALRAMRDRLAPSGRLFIDVHNRYNIAAAGLIRVLARRVRDSVAPDASNGLVSFTWQVDTLRIPTRGYLFSEREMQALFERARLRPVHRAFVHYETGERCGRWSGQMVFALEAC